MIYFDNNATTPVAPEALDAMSVVLATIFGNPSSGHAAGRAARKIVEDSRVAVAEMLGAASPTEIVFTSSGTEADNWAIAGAVDARPGKKHLITTRVEHEAVRRPFESLERSGFVVTWLDVNEQGLLDLEELRQALNDETALVSVMLANNETGVLFPVDEIGRIVKERSNALFHVDGVNAAGKTPVDLSSTEIDLFAISAHKFHGPKGIGALYIRSGVTIPSMLSGGGQEDGRRAGTEAVHQIAGLGRAARLAADTSGMQRVRSMRDRLESDILNNIPSSFLNGTDDPDLRLPNTSSISFENTNGEMIMSRLDDLGICVSTGSACNSQDHTASAVLQAMNVPYVRAMGAIRFSLSRYSTDDEVNRVLEVLPGIISDLRTIAGEDQ